MNKKLLLILFLALILRFISLNQSLWLDEGIQWWAVTTFPLKHLITEYIKGDFNPPLFHVVLYFWVKIFGDSEISLRLPSVLFGLGTVLFVYKIAELKIENSLKIGNWSLKIADATALLIATAPLLIYYSQEARMYSLAAFTTTATLYFLNRRQTIRYMLFAILMLYSHYLTWLLIPVLLVLHLLPTLLALAFLVPWLPTLWSQLNQGLGAATNPAWAGLSSLSVKNILLVPIKFLIGRLPVDFNFYYAVMLFIPLCLAAYLIYKAKNKLLYAWAFLPLILGAIISLKIPIFTYFRFVFVLPAFYLLLVEGISHLPKRLRLYAFTLFLLINLFAASRYLLDANLHREDWRSAVNYIHATDPNSRVLIISATHSPFEYYDREQSSHIHETDLNRLINQPSVWYIPYAQPIFDPQDKIRRTLNQLGFQEVSQRHFRGVTVIKYENSRLRQYSMNY
jgi:mannosyltransferase